MISRVRPRTSHIACVTCAVVVACSVVVRQSWLKAYDFVTDKAAVTLNEHAREKDPFAKVGRCASSCTRTSYSASGIQCPMPRCGLFGVWYACALFPWYF